MSREASKRKLAQPPAHRILTADELGLLKVLEVPAGEHWAGTSVVQRWGEPDRSRGITALAVSCTDVSQPSECLVAAARVGGTVSVLNANSGSELCCLPAAAVPRSEADSATVRGLSFLGPQGPGQQLLSCSAGGKARVFRRDDDAASSSGAWREAGSFQASSSVRATAVHGPSGLLACVGEGVQLSVYDVAAQSAAFQAKGGKPNRVGNVDLPHGTAVAYVPGPSGSGAAGQLVLVGTAKHKLWLYDTRVGKRPQMDLAWGESRVTALAPEADGQRVWVANGQGTIQALDMRIRSMQGTLRGAGGSVRSLAIHPSASASAAEAASAEGADASEGAAAALPLIASVGLDRFLHMHSTASRKHLGKVYCKQQMVGVAWLPPLEAAPDADADEEEGAGAEAGAKEQDATAGAAGRGAAAAQASARPQKEKKKERGKDAKPAKRSKKQ